MRRPLLRRLSARVGVARTSTPIGSTQLAASARHRHAKSPSRPGSVASTAKRSSIRVTRLRVGWSS